MRCRPLIPLLLAAVLAVCPRAASGQGVGPAALGTAAGLVGGGLVSVGIVAAQARAGDFLFSPADALGWQAAPVVLGAAGGLTLGLADSDRLGRTLIGGVAGGVVMGAVGVLVGGRLWDPPEGRWAGGVIGGAAGIVVGSIVGLVWPGDDELDGTPGVPLTFTLRF